MVTGLFATNDTVWICPLISSKVSATQPFVLGRKYEVVVFGSN
jgi:hypothetical protein